jgi:hypothetical protein
MHSLLLEEVSRKISTSYIRETTVLQEKNNVIPYTVAYVLIISLLYLYNIAAITILYAFTCIRTLEVKERRMKGIDMHFFSGHRIQTYGSHTYKKVIKEEWKSIKYYQKNDPNILTETYSRILKLFY